MCGILGQVSLNKKLKFDNKNFLYSLSLLSNRGPDDEGYFVNNQIAFGHKRLSIIDLTKSGKQPMFSQNKNSIITYNGEIYNYLELKKQLLKKGYKFNNQTDTEVLLNGLIDEGPSFIKKCNGMFAFAFYDQNKKISYIFRDRIGIKPLYYSIDENNLTFSSNIKSIHNCNKMKKEIDIESVSSYFSFRQPLGNKTFFKNIYSLEPGHYIQIKEGNIKIKKYWDYENFFLENRFDKGFDFYRSKLTELLDSSVGYRLISDVKVASLLSGGLDSTIIASIINKKIGKNFLAYSIGYNYKNYNEFKFSKLAAKNLNAKHEIVTTTAEEYYNDMDELIALRGSPLTIPNEASQYRLCREIKKKATVVLSGSGADELFCGYGRIFGSPSDYFKLKNLSIFKNIKDKKIFLKNFKNRYNKVNFNSYLDHFLSLYKYTNNLTKRRILSREVDHDKIDANIRKFFSKKFRGVNSKNYVDKMQYLFQKYHLKGILEREDNSSMASSVELRVPFLDHRLIEFAATIPNKYKIKLIKEDLTLTSDKSSEENEIPKYILRMSYENKVPRQILKRDKIGFPVPLHNWMSQKKIKDRIYSTLFSSKSKERGIFNFDYLETLMKSDTIKSFTGGSKIYQNSKAHKLWMCYNLEKFFLDIE